MYDDVTLNAIGFPFVWGSPPTATTGGNLASFLGGADCQPVPGTNALQDNDVVKVTSPLDHDITRGHLCIKGRFGYEFVGSRRRPTAEPSSGADPSG